MSTAVCDPKPWSKTPDTDQSYDLAESGIKLNSKLAKDEAQKCVSSLLLSAWTK